MRKLTIKLIFQLKYFAKSGIMNVPDTYTQPHKKL